MIVIFDLDGTLADCEHRKHHIQKEPKNWIAFYESMHLDAPIQPIMDIWHSLQVDDATLIIVTGRPVEHSDVTRKWLKAYEIIPDFMYFRKEGDYRPDDVIKEEILAEIRQRHGNPHLVFEDRKRVVDMWRRNGIICCQVAEGNF